jgi:hypothetical protein
VPDIPDKPTGLDQLAQHQRYNLRRATNALWRYAERMDNFAVEGAGQTRCMKRLTVLIAILTLLNLVGVAVQVGLALRPCPPVQLSPAPPSAPSR